MIAALILAMYLTLGNAYAEVGRSLCDQDPSFCSYRTQTVPRTLAPTPAAQSRAALTDTVTNTSSAPKPAQHPKQTRPTNLPHYYGVGGQTELDVSSALIVVAKKQLGAEMPGVRAGDVLTAILPDSVKASATVPTPITAIVLTPGPLKGARFVGEATLDRELKRVLLSFDRIRIPGTDITYRVAATGKAPNGQVGLEGEHHSREGEYFAGELLSATAAGFVDATVTRQQTLLGSQQDVTVGNAAKSGAATALARTADRFAEKTRSAPEYTEIEGDRTIQILIRESPTENNS